MRRPQPDQYARVFTDETDITARVCPQGHVYLHVGHTCVTFRKDQFIDLAHVVAAAERHLAETDTEWSSQTRH